MTKGTEASKGTDVGAEWPELPGYCFIPSISQQVRIPAVFESVGGHNE